MLFSKKLARCLVVAFALSVACAGFAVAVPQQEGNAPSASEAPAPAHKSGAAMKKPAKQTKKSAKPAAGHQAKKPAAMK